MRNGIVIALLLFAASASASPGYRLVVVERLSCGIDLTADHVGCPPFAMAGDPDSPMDMVRPLGLFSAGFGRLRLELPARARVSVAIFAINGRRVGGRDLGVLEAGSNELADLGLERAPAGIYFARVRAGNQWGSTKVIKLR